MCFICLAVISFVLSRGGIGSCLMQPCCDSVVKLKQAGQVRSFDCLALGIFARLLMLIEA
jgi:hypothetical protein